MLSTKVESHEFKPFKDAAEDYANKYSIIQLHSKLKQVLHKHLHGKSHLQTPSASSEQQHWMPRGDKTEGKGGNQSHRCAPGIHMIFTNTSGPGLLLPTQNHRGKCKDHMEHQLSVDNIKAVTKERLAKLCCK